MCRPSLVLAPLVAAVLLGLSGCGGSPASPFDGTWKVTTLPAGKEIAMGLVRIDSKEDGLHAAVVPAGMTLFAGATVTECRADGDALHLSVEVNDHSYAFMFRRPEGDAAPKRLLGSTTIRGERDFARLDRTDQKALSEKEVMVIYDAGDELKRVLASEPGEARVASLRGIAERESGRSSEYIARLALVQELAGRGQEAEAREQADRAAAFASPYGVEMRRQALRAAAGQVVASGKLPAVALDYARQADQTLDETSAPEERLPVLKVLAAALRAAGQDGDVAEVERRTEKAEQDIDRAWEERALPFEPEPYPGRRGKSGRVVLVELFTGAGCGPCVAADLAFDGLLRTAPAAEVVLVQYHLPIPTPDPLANRETMRRGMYYRVPGTPSLRVDGRHGPELGGDRDMAQLQYKRLLASIAGRLEDDAAATVSVKAARQGQRVEITAEAGGLPHDAALRLLLVEDVVRHRGGNGQRLHHHVVRAMPGGADGARASEGGARQHLTVDLDELRKKLRDELAQEDDFKDGNWPMALKRLKVVALAQDDNSQAVLQAAQADVPEE